MSLKDRIQQELNDAMRAKDETVKSSLRMLRAAIHNGEIASGRPYEDDDIIAIAKQQVKQRRDSITEFTKAGRQDLVDKEQAELEIIATYLPQQVSRDEIEAAARALIASTGASSPKDMGKVMGPLVKQFGAAADGRLVSEVVRELLAT